MPGYHARCGPFARTRAAALMGIVVFTDLDGTLLDHETYSFAAAEPALAELKHRDIPLVLASSKTAAEVAPLHDRLELGAVPAIVENGAGIHDPDTQMDAGNADYLRIRAALAALPNDLARHFRGFGDMEPAEVAQVTGLSSKAASLARQRCFSEPGLWLGTDVELQPFLEFLGTQGIVGRRGGRFLTLSFGRTKADAMRDVSHRMGASITIALGDAPNDAEMLETADFGVVVHNEHAPPMPPFSTEAQARIRRTIQPGPEGWNDAILGLLKEIGRT